MSTAYHGKILHVDLTEQRSWVEEPEEIIYRRYLGGAALSLYFLLRDLKPGIDPLSPDNQFILMTSVINGLPLSGANRYSAAAKSPLSGGFGVAEAGGYWGPELKRSGFEGVIVHGRAKKPVYLFVHDGECEIRDAAKYWGKLSDEVQEGLEAELGDSAIRVLQTGVAGENLVRYAALCNQMRHFHGRAGLGAVMGSKNLKAVVARGKQRLAPTDAAAARNILTWYKDSFDKEASGLHRNGTPDGIPSLNYDGILPTHNFIDGAFEHAEDISGATMSKTILTDRGTCFACLVECKREVSVPERGVEPKFGGMEYETIAANGSMWGVGDLKAIAEASTWCNRYVLDSISTGVSIAFAMECYEHGIITKNDTDGIQLTWGNADAGIKMIHKIARREGIGKLLGEGVKRASAALGKGSERFALHVKGQELPMHEPRGKVSLALAYSLSPTGADHCEAAHDPDYEKLGVSTHALSPLGLHEPVDRRDLGPVKVRSFYRSQQAWTAMDSVGMCIFVGAPIGDLTVQRLVDYVNAATGWDMSTYEFMKVGERANSMARLFNVREGFTAADDTLPQRMFEPLREGSLAGKSIDRDEFARAKQTYYEMAGWDKDGVPTYGNLVSLGLEWAANGRA